MIKSNYFRCLLLLPLVLWASIANCQESDIKTVLSAKDDSAKVIKLANLAYAYIDKDTTEATKLYNELMRLSTKLNYPYWVGMVWMNRGFMNARAARDEAAIQNYTEALTYLSKTQRVDKISMCHLNIGNISERLGRVDVKVAHLSEAIRLLQNTKYTNLLNLCYNSMGVLFYNEENFEKSLPYFEKAFRLSKVVKDTINTAEALHGMINCLSSNKKYDEALRYGQEILAIAGPSQNNINFLHAHTALSELYRKWGKGDSTIAHARKVVDYAIAACDVQYQLIGLMGIADGYSLTKDYAHSLIYYNKALKLGEEKSAGIQLDDIYKGLSEAYEGMHQPGPALSYYKKFVTYRDSASNEKVKRQSAELDVKYQTAQREKKISEDRLQLAQKDLQIQQNRNYLYYTLMALVVALLITALLFVYTRQKRRLHQKELKAVKQEKEIQLLQALMQGEEKERSRIAKDLHDGVAGMLAAVKMHFSSMPAVEEVAQTEGYVQGMKLLNDATQEIRKTSHNLMPEVLMQHGLDEALRRYCANVNNSRGLHIQYDSWGDIDRFNDGFELSVYRIVQELINNVLKHSKATQALVQLAQQGDVLTISIEDNGVGFASDESKEGMGLRSLQSRIRAMNGKLELEASEQSGVSAYLEFEVADLKQQNAVAV